jgi:hypothetical protein
MSEINYKADLQSHSNSRSLDRDSSCLAHFDIKTVARHPSRGKEGMKCGRVEVG